MKALVTGGMGFIGSNLSNRLIEFGWEVDVVDDLSAGKMDFLTQRDGAPACRTFYPLDFVHPSMLSAIKKQQYDVVFHLAAMPRVGYSVEHPVVTNNTNVNKALKLLDACKGNVGRFVNTSSSSVYGNSGWLPTRIFDAHEPSSPYALQKSIMEQYCKLYSSLYKMDTVSIRPFNVFGPHQLGKSAYSTAISAWLHAIKHKLPLRSDGSGEQTRDLIYVDDVVDIFIKAALSEFKFKGEAFNAGSGKAYSNNEILEWFKIKYPDITIVNAPRRDGDVMHTLADIASTEGVLHWDNKISFWEDLEKTNNWAMNNLLF